MTEAIFNSSTGRQASRGPSGVSRRPRAIGSDIPWLNGIPGVFVWSQPIWTTRPARVVAEGLRGVEAPPAMAGQFRRLGREGRPVELPDHVFAARRPSAPTSAGSASPSTGSSKRSGHSKKPSIRLRKVHAFRSGDV